jgi:hypothetical protein
MTRSSTPTVASRGPSRRAARLRPSDSRRTVAVRGELPHIANERAWRTADPWWRRSSLGGRRPESAACSISRDGPAGEFAAKCAVTMRQWRRRLSTTTERPNSGATRRLEEASRPLRAATKEATARKGVRLVDRLGSAARSCPSARHRAHVPLGGAPAVFDAVAERRDVIVVGHSLGGFTAPLVCARTPWHRG